MKKYALILLLSACTPQPVPCPPLCPNSSPTALSTPIPPATETPTPRPPTIEVSQATKGRAVVRFDLSGFTADSGLDYYAGAYLLLWEMPQACKKPDTPAIELSIRGTSQEHCLKMPCGPSALGLVARYSANIRHDGTGIPEHEMCGEGINFSRRLPIGPENIFDVAVEWQPGSVRVIGPTGSEWLADQGAAGPGFGAFIEGVACAPRGIGWAREPWSLQSHGGKATLQSWESLALGSLAGCP